MIHLTRDTKDQTFVLPDGWRLIYKNVVPNVAFETEREASDQLVRLQERIDIITPDFTVRAAHPRFKELWAYCSIDPGCGRDTMEQFVQRMAWLLAMDDDEQVTGG